MNDPTLVQILHNIDNLWADVEDGVECEELAIVV